MRGGFHLCRAAQSRGGQQGSDEKFLHDLVAFLGVILFL
jgi:hypothetical protein